MIYCLNAELAFATRAANDAVFTALVGSITSQLRVGAEQFEKKNSKFGPFGMFIIMRFRASADARALGDLIAAQAVINPPQPGSFYRIHSCRHDEKGACDPGTTVTF